MFSQVCKVVPGSVRFKSSVKERPGCSGASLSAATRQQETVGHRTVSGNQAQEYLTLSLITGEWNMLFLTQAAA